MSQALMSYKGQIKIGTAGSQANTQITNHTGATISIGSTTVEDTPHGSGSAIPIETKQKTKRSLEFKMTMLNVDDDTNITTLRTAENLEAGIALYLLDKAAGRTWYDGDCNVESADLGADEHGRQQIEITFTPNRISRTPTIIA